MSPKSKMAGRFVRLPAIALGVLALSLGGCGLADTVSSALSNLGSNFTNISSSVTGSVSSAVISSNGSSKIRRGLASEQSNACANISFEAYLVGGGTTPIATGSAANGVFTATWNQSVASGRNASEVVMVFQCMTAATTTLRCFGKPGDGAMVCDPVSNAIVAALEDSIGASVVGDELFTGLEVSVMAKGMVETLKLVARLDPTADLTAQLAAATSLDGLKAVINGSPIGALFTAMSSLASETRITNQQVAAGNTDSSAVEAALAQAWTIDSVVERLVGLGIEIDVGISDDGEGGPSLYGSIAQLVDSALPPTLPFMANMRDYVSRLHTTLYENNSGGQVSMLCVARDCMDYQRRPIEYPPEVESTLDGGIKKLTCLGTDAQALGLNSNNTSCDGGGGPMQNQNNQNRSYRLSMILRSASQEPNRNDVNMERADERELKAHMGVVDIFPEIEALIQGACAEFWGDDPDGEPGPDADLVALGECMRARNADKYFSGLLGVYRALVNPTLRTTKLSMEDVHAGLVDGQGVRMSGRSPFGRDGFEVEITDPVRQDRNRTFMPMLLYPTGEVHPQDGRPILALDCQGGVCDNNPGFQQAQMTTAQYEGRIAASRPPFELMFGDLTTIPTMAELRADIFGAAHHEPYNVAGRSSFRVAGKDTGGDHQAEKPILCVFKNGDTIVRDFTPGTTAVTCEIAEGTWANGRQTVAGANGTNYAKYWGLEFRGDPRKDVYFAFLNPNTGQTYHRTGREMRLRELSTATDAGSDVADGSTLYRRSQQWCDRREDEQGNQRVDCHTERFDYVALRFPNSNTDNTVSADDSFFPVANFYEPYFFFVPIELNRPEDGMGGDNNNNNPGPGGGGIDIAFTNNDTDNDFEDDYPVCVKDAGITTDNNDLSVATGTTLASNVVDCFDNEEDTFYYLGRYFDHNGSPPSNKSEVNYELIRNDGTKMTTGTDNCGTNSDEPCPFLVALSAVETALGKSLGPNGNEVSLSEYDMANLRHNAKFDPFCYDDDDDGVCDCKRDTTGDGTADTILDANSTPSADDCTLEDDIGDEETLSEGPMWEGDPNAPSFWYMQEQCGNLSGAALASCLTGLQGHDFTMMHFDHRRVFKCETAGRDLHWVNPHDVVNNPNNAGGNCGSNGMPGTVTFRKIVERENAYDIARPQTLLKLISQATATVGTGVTIADTSAKQFSFIEAIALAFVRMTLPVDNVAIFGPNFRAGSGTLATDANAYVEYPGFTVFYRDTENITEDKHNDAVSSILRIFLENGGFITPAAN